MIDKEIIKAFEICKDEPCVCSSDNDIDTVLDLINRQKAEIERLTGENGWLSKECNKATAERAELQKQVYERENEIDRLEKVVHDQAEQYWDCNEQAVKDTAKEMYTQVLEWIPICEGYGEFINNLESWLKECYGVEVE